MIIVVFFSALLSKEAYLNELVYGDTELALSRHQVEELWNITQNLKFVPNKYDGFPVRTVTVEIGANLTLKLSRQVNERLNFLKENDLDFRIVWYILSFQSLNWTIPRAIAYDHENSQYKSMFSSWIQTNKNGELIIGNVQANITEIYFAVGVELQGVGFAEIIKRYSINVFRHLTNGICDGRRTYRLQSNAISADLNCGIIYCQKLQHYLLDPNKSFSYNTLVRINSMEFNKLRLFSAPIKAYAPTSCRIITNSFTFNQNDIKNNEIVNCSIEFSENGHYSKDVEDPNVSRKLLCKQKIVFSPNIVFIRNTQNYVVAAVGRSITLNCPWECANNCTYVFSTISNHSESRRKLSVSSNKQFTMVVEKPKNNQTRIVVQCVASDGFSEQSANFTIDVVRCVVKKSGQKHIIGTLSILFLAMIGLMMIILTYALYRLPG